MGPLNSDLVEILREPQTGRSVLQVRADAEEGTHGFEIVALRTNGHGQAPPVGKTDWLLKVEGEDRYYPIMGEIPILLRPEALGPADHCTTYDLDQPAFQEAYLEMEFYNQFADAEAADLRSSSDFLELSLLREQLEALSQNLVPSVWLDAVHDVLAQRDAYQELAPLSADRTFMQIGGKGLHALKLLVGGAGRSLLLSPMLGEAQFGMKMADEFDIRDRFAAVVGVAEELPFADESVDGIYAGGCAHHFEMSLAMPEVERMLSSGSSFAAVEPYRNPLYDVGTKLVGKREANAHCSPMDDGRIAPLHLAFPDSEVRHHGTFLRYPLLALSKVGVSPSRHVMLRIASVDDRLAKSVRLSRYGSSVALIGRKRS